MTSLSSSSGPKDVPIVSRQSTYKLGAVVSIGAMILVGALLGSIGLGVRVTILAAFVAGVVVFALGLVNVKVGYQAVLVVLGKRRDDFKYGEGIHWVVPFVTWIDYVDHRQQHSDVPANKVLTSDRLDLYFDLETMWRIDDPYARLNTNVGDVEGAVKSAIRAASVSIAGKYTEEDIKTKHQTKTARSEYGNEKMSDLEREIADDIGVQIAIFGGRVLKVYISSLLPAPELIDARRRKQIEEAEQEAEAIQNTHIIKEVKRIQSELGISFGEAQQMFYVQIEKASLNIDQKRLDFNSETQAMIGTVVQTIADAIIATKKGSS